MKGEEMSKAYSTNEQDKNAGIVLVGMRVWKGLFVRTSRWKDSMKKDIEEEGWEVMGGWDQNRP
jgi:hypothetical protein